MNILITGVNGFLGKYLFENLHRCLEKAKVYGIMRNPETKAENIFLCNLLNYNEILKVFEDINVDIIIHSAGSADLSKEEAANGYFNNIVSTSNLVKAAIKNKTSRLIFFSSLLVYGNSYQIEIDQEEKSSPFEWYSNSKYLCENILKDNKDYLESISLRLPTVLGKGRTIPVLVTDMINSLLKNGYIEVFGAGKARRQFLDIKDFFNIIKEAVFMNIKRNPLTIPVVSDEVTTIGELAELIVKLYGSGMVKYNLEKKDSMDKYINPTIIRKYFNIDFTPLKKSIIDSFSSENIIKRDDMKKYS